MPVAYTPTRYSIPGRTQVRQAYESGFIADAAFVNLHKALTYLEDLD